MLAEPEIILQDIRVLQGVYVRETGQRFLSIRCGCRPHTTISREREATQWEDQHPMMIRSVHC